MAVSIARFAASAATLVATGHTLSGLTLRQWAICAEIVRCDAARKEPCTTRYLAARLHIHKSVVSRVCETTGRLALTRRFRNNPRDRRDVIIYPTPRLVALMQEVINDV